MRMIHKMLPVAVAPLALAACGFEEGQGGAGLPGENVASLVRAP